MSKHRVSKGRMVLKRWHVTAKPSGQEKRVSVSYVGANNMKDAIERAKNTSDRRTTRRYTQWKAVRG